MSNGFSPSMKMYDWLDDFQLLFGEKKSANILEAILVAMDLIVQTQMKIKKKRIVVLSDFKPPIRGRRTFCMDPQKLREIETKCKYLEIELYFITDGKMSFPSGNVRNNIHPTLNFSELIFSTLIYFDQNAKWDLLIFFFQKLFPTFS